MESEAPQEQADASAVIQSLQERQDACTVGYGDRYPEPEVSGLVVEDNNSATGIRHVDRSSEIGYDLTTFGAGVVGVERFLGVLRAVGLDPRDDYVRVYRDLGRDVNTDYRDRYLHVWVNDDVLVACSNNPVTGEGHSPSHRGRKGEAGTIGVGGDKQLVKDAVAGIDAVANTKDKRDGGLFY